MNENVAYWNTEALSCVSMAYSSLKALLPNTSIHIFFMFYVYGTKYSRMDQVKFVEDSLNNFTWSIFEYLVPYFIYYECGVLGDLIPFVQFKKREKQPWRSVTFRFNKSNTPPRVFFTF